MMCARMFQAVTLISILMYCCHGYNMPDDESPNKTLTIGLLVPFSQEWDLGRYIASTIIPAIERVKQLQLLPEYEIEWTWKDSGCTPFLGFRAAIEMWRETPDLDAFIGAACSVVCQPVALLAAAWNIPMVSYSCSSSALSNPEQFPTFFRTLGIQDLTAPIPGAVLDLMGWDRVAIITTPEDLWANGAKDAKTLYEQAGKLVYFHVVPSATTNGAIDEAANQAQLDMMRTVKTEARYVVFFMYWDDCRLLMLHAYDEGMLNGDYIFFSHLIHQLVFKESTYRPEVPNSLLFEGVFTAERIRLSGPEWVQLQEDVIEAFDDPQFQGIDHITDPQYVNTYAGFMYDAVQLWAHGVNRTLAAGGSPDDGEAVTQNIHNFSFNGISGEVTIDDIGDRMSDYLVFLIQSDQIIPVFLWHSSRKWLENLYSDDPLEEWAGVYWPGHTSTFPSGIPACGWQEELCQPSNTKFTINVLLGVILAFAFTVMILAVLFKVYRRKLLQLEEQELEERIFHSSLIILPGQGSGDQHSRAASHLGSTLGDVTQFGDVTMVQHVRSNGSESVLSGCSPDMSLNLQQRLENPVGLEKLETCQLHGRMRSIKVFEMKGLNANNKQVRAELKQLLAISHGNLNPVIGFSVTSTSLAVISEHASRGCLHDLIENASTKLQWDLKISFICDVIRGLGYIHHNPLQHHGNLSSFNCLIDKNWTLKITDYGLATIHRSSGSSQHSLWTAPEILNSISECTKASDIYSLGILVNEILSESAPYSSNCPELTREDILDAVKSHQKPCFRPHIDANLIPIDWIVLVTSCWHDNPQLRPDIAEVKSNVVNLNGGSLPNLVDAMVENLERHTCKLEATVHHRTQELYEEKSKMDALLSELLPANVVSQLHSGVSVTPEIYDEVTMFFSDIVGFTQVSTKSSPMQVVEMLNKLYSSMDGIIGQYDAYKVATIGDAYFVVSGLPTRNGDAHAHQIALLSRDVMSAVSEFTIPHLDDESLQMRIGLHTGPCVAAVAGVKTPRYLLFGESVDIASRIEAGGEPMNIHLSYTTADILKRSDEWQPEYRGEMCIPGVGKLKTYWLGHSGLV